MGATSLAAQEKSNGIKLDVLRKHPDFNNRSFSLTKSGSNKGKTILIAGSGNYDKYVATIMVGSKEIVLESTEKVTRSGDEWRQWVSWKEVFTGKGYTLVLTTSKKTDASPEVGTIEITNGKLKSMYNVEGYMFESGD